MNNTNKLKEFYRQLELIEKRQSRKPLSQGQNKVYRSELRRTR